MTGVSQEVETTVTKPPTRRDLAQGEAIAAIAKLNSASKSLVDRGLMLTVPAMAARDIFEQAINRVRRTYRIAERAELVGRASANLTFTKRGNRSEVHLKREELTAIVVAAVSAALQHDDFAEKR